MLVMSAVLHTALLLLLVANAVNGVQIRGALSAVLAALVLGLVNAFVRPLAVALTLPLTLITFGLFLLVLNGLMLKLAAALVPGFRIRGIMPAVWGSLLLTLLNLLIDGFMGPGW